MTHGKPPRSCPALILQQAAHPASRAASCSSNSSLCVHGGLAFLCEAETAQLSTSAVQHSLSLHPFKMFSLFTPSQFHCQTCPKCPLYSLSISLQLSLEETLAAGDFPVPFTCWGILLIWYLTLQLTQQGLNRTSILQENASYEAS